MSKILFSLLDASIGQALTHGLALEIMRAASIPDPLISPEVLEQIVPVERGGFVFAIERLEKILEEMKPLHQAHWDEKEEEPGRPGFNPNYDRFISFEKAGRAIVFTVREHGRLIGNFSLYVHESMHTRALLAQEDTLYLVPEARKGRLAARLIDYAEQALKKLGVTEINVTVKIANRHGRYFQMLGYEHVSNGLTKYLEN